MKPIYILLIASLSLVSCYNKSVQLPVINNSSITEVLDVSPAYIFYDETKKDSTEFNRKNLIGSTNWLINIDKRLTLKQIIPHLIYLQNKRSKDGMHNNENARNYFTCSNPEIQNLAFIDYTDIVYHNNENKIADDYYEITFSNNEILFAKDLTIDKNDFVNSLNKMKNDSITIKLNFKENLTFQNYIIYKEMLLGVYNPNVTIDNNEFIY